MKKVVVIAIVILMATSHGFSQAICDSIQFYSNSIYLTPSTDDSVRIKFDYDWTVNPSIAYPSYYVSLDDTSNIVFHYEFLGTFLGQQDSIDFPIIYKNPDIAEGYSVTGTFDIHDPNDTPTLICQFPLEIIFSTPLFAGNELAPLNFAIFPNPFADQLIVDAEIEHFDKLFITDLTGLRVLELHPVAQQKVDTSVLPNGIYFITGVGKHGQIRSRKLIKYQSH